MRTALLILSLLANVAAATYFAMRDRSPTDAPVAANVVGPKSSATSRAPDALDASTGLPPAELASVKATWPQSKAGDLSALMAELKAQGFPPGEINAIIRAVALDGYRARWSELLKDDSPYWKNPAFYRDPKRLAELRQLNAEQRKRLNDLLGPGSEDELYGDMYVAGRQRRFGNMPAEKAMRADQVIQDYSELTSEVYTAAQQGGGGQMILLPEDREKLQYLENQKREDLAKILTPEELLDYDLRTSNTAAQLRQQLIGFNPTEEEFRTIFKLQHALDLKLGTANGVTNAEQYRQREAALKELQPQLEAELGPERAAAFKQASDPQYAQVNRLVARLELPQTAAADVVAVQKDIQARATALRTNRGLSAEERSAQINALSQEAATRVSTALGGQKGLEAYRQYGGAWMQNLQPRPTPSAR